MNHKQRRFLWLSLASGLAINLVGIIRLLIGAPIELWLGLSLSSIAFFRLFSWGIDLVLSFFFGFAREGMYRLRFANRNNRWHRFVLDTVSISIYKNTSYILSLWLLIDLPKRSFWLLVGINVFLFILTGALSCWYIDVLHRQLPDLTQKIMDKIKRKRVKNVSHRVANIGKRKRNN
ncbi:MAG: hypothetical protein NTV48_00905 [Candidatus Vogelbacteria bacterium]|nr:hypothetical protein [Candidatus Vogelbacteria bacterium]